MNYYFDYIVAVYIFNSGTNLKARLFKDNNDVHLSYTLSVLYLEPLQMNWQRLELMARTRFCHLMCR